MSPVRFGGGANGTTRRWPPVHDMSFCGGGPQLGGAPTTCGDGIGGPTTAGGGIGGPTTGAGEIGGPTTGGCATWGAGDIGAHC
jgi:hypothetical protein